MYNVAELKIVDYNFYCICNHDTKLRIYDGTLAIKRLQKYFQVVDAEDAYVADAATFS